jgi:hypothetical protein
MLSPWHWIYWSSTVAITACVLGYWAYFKGKDNKNISGLPNMRNEEGKVALYSANHKPAVYNMTDLPEEVRRVRRFCGW